MDECPFPNYSTSLQPKFSSEWNHCNDSFTRQRITCGSFTWELAINREILESIQSTWNTINFLACSKKGPIEKCGFIWNKNKNIHSKNSSPYSWTQPNFNLHRISQSLIRTRSTIQKLPHKKHVMDQHQDAWRASLRFLMPADGLHLYYLSCPSP